MLIMKIRTAYDSGRHFAAAGLTPNWAALWVSGRLDAFRRGYEAGLAERRQASPAANIAERGGSA
ncbi:hypothetical protein [Inquilinus limosus]|uniref:hypothetical protein n=1 Tax=Inquilinus limosus TaxID=171674 RepID=UPI000417860F|nr:hypothetical protein [Inquilinus limosus]